MGSSELWGCIEDSKVSSTTWIQSSSSSKCLSWAATSECAILTCNRLYCICSEVRPNQAGFISIFIRISTCSLFIMCQTCNSIYKILIFNITKCRSRKTIGSNCYISKAFWIAELIWTSPRLTIGAFTQSAIGEARNKIDVRCHKLLHFICIYQK